MRSVFNIRSEQKIAESEISLSISNRFKEEGYTVRVDVKKDIAKISTYVGGHLAFFRVLLPEDNQADFAFNRVKDQLELRTKIANMDEALD